jgi:hypothetical protein
MNTVRVNREPWTPVNEGAKPQDGLQETVVSPGPIAAHEISMQAWQVFCQWCSQSMQGIVTDIERDTGQELRVVECRQKPLQQIVARTAANGVTSIDVTVLMNGKPRIFEVAGPSWLRLHCNAAGLPLVLDIGYEGGKMVLHFTGATLAAPVFSGNSWGE